MRGIGVLATACVICMTLFAGSAQALEEDETALFTSAVPPDALLLLDLSGSMNWPPPGPELYVPPLLDLLGIKICSCLLSILGAYSGPYYASSGTGHTCSCDVGDTLLYNTLETINFDALSDPLCSLTCILTLPLTCKFPIWGSYANDCAGPYYRCRGAVGSDHHDDCSRLAIAKRAIFDLLDDNDSETVTHPEDSESLNVRVGYMSWRSGLTNLVKEIGTRYSRIICDNSTSCSSAIATCSKSDREDCPVAGASATGGTPIASSLETAKTYLDANKAADAARACRPKFVILITDGSDTLSCSGNGREDQSDQYKRRKATVAKAKALADAGYKVFVIGFGALMPEELKRTLNWTARYGGTDDPFTNNTGDPDAVFPSTSPCTEGDTNDPADAALSGYAFFAASPNALATALKTVISLISEATYSFAVPAVASVREADENNLYQASFQPQNDDPFWPGQLIKYNINTDGSLGSEVWNANDVLAATAAADRVVYTYKSGSMVAFTTGNISRTDLNVASDLRRDEVVGYVRGESAYNPDTESGSVLKLGDIFRANPEIIGTPIASFNDFLDSNNAFAQFRTAHQRTSAANNRLIVAGSNDGQLHAFKTGTGVEAWSFIPPNLLPKLQLLAHSHPTTLTHQYFVDGPITRSDVWLGTGDGSSKSASDWKTYLVFGLGRGVEPLSSYLWSSSSYCDTGFRATYHATLSPYYCGYYALDLTDTSSAPVYKWRLNPNSSQAPYLGDPWGKVSIARVKIGDGTNKNEKWVGFVGGGYNVEDCAGGGSCDTRGKGFFIIDMANGNILWSYSQADNSAMDYSLPAPPATLDTDNDGFVDRVYIGDIGGNMWRFSLCSRDDDETCDTTDWTGGKIFDSSTGVIRPIYTKPVAARDTLGNLWLYWGTGDKTDPTSPSAQEKFFALIDGGLTYGINDLENITSSSQAADATKQGWYMNFTGQGEKVLGEPAVFGGVVYFTTYTPATGGDPCAQAGTPKLYGVDYTTGAGALYKGTENETRDVTLSGVGIPSAPIISLAPGGSPIDVIVSLSGGAGQEATIITNPPGVNPQGLSSMRNIRYWKDKRVQ